MKQIFVLFVVILLLVPIGFAQDNDTEIDDIFCETDANCAEGQFCDEDECEDIECSTDEGCDEDEVCEGNECIVQNPETGDNIIGNDTEDEIDDIRDRWGAKVRFLQLEKRIQRNIVRAEGVVAYIQENYPEADVVQLETILQEMNMLLEDVQVVSTQNPDYGTVKQFVELKNDAIELSKNFRDIARELIPPGEREEVRKRLEQQEQDEESLKNKQEEVLSAIREYNAHRIQVMLEALSLEDEELVEQIRNGELNYGQANSKLIKHYATLEPQEKRQARNQFRENIRNRREFRGAVEEEVEATYLERREERLRNRIKNIDKFNETAVASKLLSERLNKAEVVRATGGGR